MKEKKKKGLCLVQNVITKKPRTLFFQPRPTPPPPATSIISAPPIINNY